MTTIEIFFHLYSLRLVYVFSKHCLPRPRRYAKDRQLQIKTIHNNKCDSFDIFYILIRPHAIASEINRE